jgi:hypothetical protein
LKIDERHSWDLSGKTNQELRNRVLFTWFSAWKAALDKFDLAVVI